MPVGRGGALKRALASVVPARLRAYREYWSGLVPQNDRQRFERWLFAYASVQRGWRQNVLLYRVLSGLGPSGFARHRLPRAVSRFGLMQQLSGLTDFHAAYWDDPGWWRPWAWK